MHWVLQKLCVISVLKNGLIKKSGNARMIFAKMSFKCPWLYVSQLKTQHMQQQKGRALTGKQNWKEKVIDVLKNVNFSHAFRYGWHISDRSSIFGERVKPSLCSVYIQYVNTSLFYLCYCVLIVFTVHFISQFLTFLFWILTKNASLTPIKKQN